MATLADVIPQVVTTPPSRLLTFRGDRGSAPPSSEWTFNVGGHGWGNNELQTYTESRENAALDGNGNLTLTALKETVTAADGIKRKYTSARLTTEGQVEIPPGSYVESTISPAIGDGLWPAFWLMGANVGEVGWPAAGELDVLEVLGGDTNTATSYIHVAAADDPHKDVPFGGAAGGGKTSFDYPLDTASHRFGVYFDDSVAAFFIDGQLIMSLTADQAATTNRSWPFGNPQMVIVNLAIGGQGGDPAGTPFPQTMTVGPISVWSNFVDAKSACS